MFSLASSSNNFDWVAARNECSLDKVFHLITMGVESDVTARNAQLDRSLNPFQTAYDGHDMKVFRRNRAAQDIIRIKQTETGIRVVNEVTGKAMLEATLTLNDEGECRLRIADRELEFWQFRRRALEWIFFDSIGSL